MERSYNKDHIYLRTTDHERTFNSAESLIDGLYPPAFRNSSKTEVIDIDTIEQETDNLYPTNNCPKLNTLCANEEKTPAWLQVLSRYEKLYKEFEKVWNVEEIPDWFVLFGAFESMVAHKIPLPQGVTKEMVEEVHNVSALQMGLLYGNTSIATLGIGRFIYDFREALLLSINNRSSIRFALYSAHDVTVGLILNLLDLYSQAAYWPPFASHIVFEYWQENSGNLFVKIYYNGNELFLPGCPRPCPLSYFIAILNRYALLNDQWKKLCQVPRKQRYSSIDPVVDFLC